MLTLGACLQSTEGFVRRRNKMFGRVGDSPLLGAGTWAAIQRGAHEVSLHEYGVADTINVCQ